MTRKEQIRFRNRFFKEAGANVAMFADMLRELPDAAFYIKDASGRIVTLNRRNCEICNLRDEFAAVGRRSDELFADERGKIYLDQDQKVRATGRLRKTSHAHPADGAMHISHKTIAPVRDRKGAIIGTMAVYRHSDKPQPFLDWHGRIKKVTAYANAHPTSDLSLARLAAYAETTPSKLARAFLKILHVTPSAYVMTMRVNLARRRLESSDDSLTVIARSCGFYDLSHFFHAFRRERGLTPGEYRANHRSISSVTPNRTPAR